MVRAVTTAGQTLSSTLVVTSRALNSSPPTVAPGSSPDDVDTWYAGTGFDGDRASTSSSATERLRALQSVRPDRSRHASWFVGIPTVSPARPSWTPGAATRTIRFDFESLLEERTAPKKPAKTRPYARRVYADLHELPNTFWFPVRRDRAGPGGLGFVEYVMRPPSWPAPRDESAAFWSASRRRFHGMTLPPRRTDSEEGGQYVADGVEAGRPGVVGVRTVSLHTMRSLTATTGSRRFEAARWWNCALVQMQHRLGLRLSADGTTPKRLGSGSPRRLAKQHPHEAGRLRPSFNPILFSEASIQVAAPPSSMTRVVAVDLLSWSIGQAPGSFERVHSPDAATPRSLTSTATSARACFRSSPAATVSTAGSSC